MEEMKRDGPDPLGQDKKQLQDNQRTNRKQAKKSPVSEVFIEHGKVPPQAVDLMVILIILLLRARREKNKKVLFLLRWTRLLFLLRRRLLFLLRLLSEP